MNISDLVDAVAATDSKLTKAQAKAAIEATFAAIRDPAAKGDQIFNGAADNAAGTAVLLEVAQAMQALPPDAKPKRSVLFLAVTAEEKGLLGSRYYAQTPLYPLTRTLANINMDGANQFGRTSDMEVIGFGASTLDDIGMAVAQGQGRIMPAFYPKAGKDVIGQPDGYGRQRESDYRTHDYHKVTDEVKPWWNFDGTAEDTQLLIDLGREIADGTTWPAWKPGTEFKAKRDAMLKR